MNEGMAMRLTRYSDYAVRVLIYLGTRGDRLCSIGEIAHVYGISQNHLMKVVNDLARGGYVASVRGRSGGIRLGRPAAEIRLGEVLRYTEDGFELTDCGSCLVASACGLSHALGEALAAFLAVLDRYTLEDIMVRRVDLHALFGQDPPEPATLG